MTARRLTPAWRTVLDEFVAEHPAEGAAQRARLTRVRRLGEDLGGDPWEVTPGDVQRWLDSLEASAEATRKHRHAARAFYRWAIDVGHTDTNPVLAAPIGYTTDAQWSDAIAQFSRAQVGAGLSHENTQIRCDHARRLGRELALSPWHVTAADYSAWVAGLQVADSTRAKMRDSIRAFYRWAHTAGRIDVDPTDEPSRRATTPDVPEQWAAVMRPYRSALRAAGHPEATVRLRLTQIRRFARDHASLDPWDVTPDDLIDWMAGQSWASETRRANRSTLRTFYRWAVDTGRTDVDPTDRLPAVRMSKPLPRPAHEDEYARALREAQAGNAPARDVLALRLAAELGMRCAEVAHVHARDVAQTPEGWTLLVNGKGSKQRSLPLSEGLAARIREGGGYAFPGADDGHLSPGSLSRRISRLLPAGVTMHALRHRFATRAYNMSRDVFTVQQLLGHSSPATTQRYVLVADDAKRALVEAVALL